MLRLLYSAPLVLLSFLTLNPSSASAQTRFEQLGGVPLEGVRVTFDGDTDLLAGNVGLLERAYREWDFDHSGGYGYAYRSWHLTFVSSVTAPLDWPAIGRKLMLVRLFDEEGALLTQRRIRHDQVGRVCVGSDPTRCTYEIDFIDVPLADVDLVARVDLIVVR